MAKVDTKGGPDGDAVVPEAPSVIDAHAVGGLDAWNGFDRQARFIALRVPQWLNDPQFLRMTPEQGEDVDVEVQDGARIRVDHYQVKTEEVTPAPLRQWVEEFERRNRQRLQSGLVRHYIVASAHVSEKLRGVFLAIERFRNASFPAGDEASKLTSEEALLTRLRDLNLGSVAKFIVASVNLDRDFAETETDDSTVVLLAARLLGLEQFQHFTAPTAQAAARRLLDKIREKKRYTWSREALQKLVLDAAKAHLEGPPRPAGDVVFVRHQSFSRVTQGVTDKQLLDKFSARRQRTVEVDSIGVTMKADLGALESAVSALIDVSQPFRAALEAEPPAELIYFGFPHVPLATLAGFIVGQQRHVYVVEHDRDAGVFAWPAGVSPKLEFLEPEVASGQGGVVRLRISISAPVRPELCEVGGDVGLDLHISLRRPAVDVVRSESDAREVARAVRQLVASKVSGIPQFKAMHVFAAVPVSVAFLLGQVFSMKALPPSVIYNYAGGGVHVYDWAINLHETGNAQRGVMVRAELTEPVVRGRV